MENPNKSLPQLVYSKPGEDATRIAKEFWFKFYEEGDIMIGKTDTHHIFRTQISSLTF